MKNKIASVSLLSFALLVAGCGGLGQREQKLYDRTLTASESGDWETVRGLSTQILEVEPEHTPSRVLRGRSLLELGHYDDALSDLGMAAETGLPDEERFTVLLYQGRCWIELGCTKFPLTDFHEPAVSSKERRAARDAFVKANSILSEAMELQPRSYDAGVWRAYAVLRLENYGKAIELLEECASLEPGRWEHRFFSALAFEGIYDVNSKSLDEYLAITRSGPRSELAPLYEYLIVICDDVSPETARRIFDAETSFADAVPHHSPVVDEFLIRFRKRMEEHERHVRFEDTRKQVETLVQSEQYDEAVKLIEGAIAEEGDHPEARQLLWDTRESWSDLLEVRTEDLIRSTRREDLTAAYENYQLARKLTRKVERLVVLQQKLNAVELAINRQESSLKIRDTYELLKKHEYRKVLDTLADTTPNGLSHHDRDLYQYLVGVSNYHLGHWTAAVNALAAMKQRNFEGVDAMYGLALVRSGQEQAGFGVLTNLPPRSRNDDVNRALGHHYAQRGEYRRAAEHLSLLEKPGRRDHEVHLDARRRTGIEYYEQGNYTLAIAELETARQIVEGALHQTATDVDLYLGNSYYHMNDLEKAKRIYQDLSDSNVSGPEMSRYRELYLNRGNIHLKDKHADLAYRDFSEFVRLGGVLPEDLVNVHGRLLATYGDFMPLDKIRYWNYASTTLDYNYSLYLREEAGGEYQVEHREGSEVSREVWSRQGIFLTRQVGDRIDKLPVNLSPADEALPFLEYASHDQDCRAEVVAIQQTVELPGGRRFTDCLKVRIRRTRKTSGGKLHSSKDIVWLAPNVGQVKKEIYRDGTKVSEIVLSDYAMKLATAAR